MKIVPVATLTGVMYKASINQKGVKCSAICKTYKEALVTCFQNYCYYLKG